MYAPTIISPKVLSNSEAALNLSMNGPVMLAEGDSWFSYGSIPGTNLLEHLRLPSPSAIINFAIPGTTLKDIQSKIHHTRDLRQMRDELIGFLDDQGTNWKFRTLLLSTGGNDLVDHVPELFRKGHYDTQAAKDFAARLTADITGFVKSIRQKGGRNKDIRIVTHTYDYIVPSFVGGKMFGVQVTDSWVAPALKKLGIPEVLWTSLTREIMEMVAAAIQAVDDDNFVVVNTLGYLGEGDWENEIHPNAQGYKKLAVPFSKAIEAHL